MCDRDRDLGVVDGCETGIRDTDEGDIAGDGDEPKRTGNQGDELDGCR